MFADFLLWLRSYNETADEKVKTLGLLDVDLDFLINPLFDYLNAFYETGNKEVFYSILDKTNKGDINGVLDEIKKNSEKLKFVMGEDEYFLCTYTLQNMLKIQPKRFSYTDIISEFENRDYYMMENAQAFITRFLDNNFKAMIYAHYAHVKKRRII